MMASSHLQPKPPAMVARVLGGVHIELDGWGVQIEAGHGLELVAVHVKEGLVSWPWWWPWWSKQAPRGPLDIPGLVMTNSLLLKMAIEIVSFPIKNGDFP